MSSDISLTFLIGLAAAAVIILYLRGGSVRDAADSPSRLPGPREADDEDVDIAIEGLADELLELDGTLDGVEYSALQDEDELSVYVDLPRQLEKDLVVEALESRPEPPGSPYDDEIAELLDLGANHIAIGDGEIEQVCADIEASSKTIDKALVERIAAILIRIRSKAARR